MYSLSPGISTVNLPSCTSIGTKTFANCANLVNLNIPAATSIGDRAFENCTGLTSLSGRCNSLGNYAFSGCSNIVTVNVTGGSTWNGYCFNNCTSLTTIDVTGYIRIYGYCFAGCTSLNSLTLHSSTLCTLDSPNYFNGTPIANGTGHVYVPQSMMADYEIASGWNGLAWCLWQNC